MSDLVKKLRSTLSNEPSDDALWERVIAERQDAADEIERLAAEAVRLRDALEAVATYEIASFAINPLGGPDIVVEGSSRFVHERDVKPLLKTARAALSQKESTP